MGGRRVRDCGVAAEVRRGERYRVDVGFGGARAVDEFGFCKADAEHGMGPAWAGERDLRARGCEP